MRLHRLRRARWVHPVNRLSPAIVILVVLPLWATSEQQRHTIRQDPPERFLRSYERFVVDPAETEARVRAGRKIEVPTPDGAFEFALTPHDVRGEAYVAEDTADGSLSRLPVRLPVHTYRGTVEGRPDVEVRFSVRSEAFEGLILTPREWYFVEPARNYDPEAPAQEYLTYRASDVNSDAFGTCGTTIEERMGTARDLLGPLQRNALGGLIVADVATEADHEYVNAMGGADGANAAILDILNQVDGIYRSQLSLSLRVVYQHTWSSAADPYDSTAPSAMLTEFRGWFSTNPAGVNFDLAHMWSGKNMDGSTVGIAYLDVVCNARSYSYGVSQIFSAAPGKYILTAHEIGHNFGATHTDQASPVPPDCGNTIMNSAVGSGTTFCQFSRDEVGLHLVRYSSCLEASASTGGCDITGEGQVNVLDLQRLANVILSLASCSGNCDVNGDGRVDVLDLQRLANVILGISTCP